MKSRSPTQTITTARRVEPRRAPRATPVVFLPLYRHGLPIPPDAAVASDLDCAFAAFWGYRHGYAPAPSDDQVALLLAYLRYCLAAPIRRTRDYAWLRESADRSHSLADLYGLYDAAAAAGVVF